MYSVLILKGAKLTGYEKLLTSRYYGLRRSESQVMGCPTFTSRFLPFTHTCATISGMAEDESESAARQSAYEQQALDELRRGTMGKESRGRYEQTEGFTSFRPLEVLAFEDFKNLHEKEKKMVKEALIETVLTPFVSFSAEIDSVLERASAKKHLYTGESGLDRTMYAVAQTETMIYTASSEANAILLGTTQSEQKRMQSVSTMWNYALPYLSMYWGGMETMRILSERGAQLPMADMGRFFQGTRSKWVTDGLNGLLKYQPDTMSAIPLARFVKKEEDFSVLGSIQKVETLEIAESFTDRLARYTADADYWTRIRGEMNTHNPILGGRTKEEKEKLYITEATQQFVADLSRRIPRTNENGSVEKIDAPQKVTIFFDADGKQIPQEYVDEDGIVLRSMAQVDIVKKRGGTLTLRLPAGVTASYSKEIHVELLDYWNKAKSDIDRKWVVATTAAMCIENAKEILDSLPPNVNLVDGNSEDAKKYKALFRAVKERAENIMENYDSFSKAMLEEKIAKTAFDLSYAMAFGTMSIGDIGWNFEWKLSLQKDANGKEMEGKFIWDPEGSQGDPTASGDAFSARRPYFHDTAYAAVKGRISANTPGAGVLMSVDSKQGAEFVNVLLSEAEEINQRGRMIERLKNGEQPHIARYFGVLGAYAELGAVDKTTGEPLNPLAYDAWKTGENIRIKTGKEANKNLIQTIEETVMFVPTPFQENGKTLFYPVLMPQFQVSLYDMLTVSKDLSVGDLMRKTWTYNSDGILVEMAPEAGGKRLTQRDIDWEQYGGYADDSHAVNDNFLSQVYGPLYGAYNGKTAESIVANPMAGIGAIIKAVDIGARSYIKKLNGGGQAKRQSYEIMYASTIIFQYLSFGMLGRGGIKRFQKFTKELSPEDMAAERTSGNLYTLLRSVTDIIPEKQGYTHYSDGFYLTLLAMAESLKPLVVASEKVARKTTYGMTKDDTLSVGDWNKVVDAEAGVSTPEQIGNLDKFIK